MRIDIGQREASEKIFPITCRTGKKFTVAEGLLREVVQKTLDEIQLKMLDQERVKLDECLVPVVTWNEFTEVVGQKKLALAQWCGHQDCEASIKKR